MHRIYLAATMGYGLGFNNSELSYYKKLRKEMHDMKRDAVKKGITLTCNNQEEKNWLVLIFLVNWWEPYT